MGIEFPLIGYREKCGQQRVSFPPQHQPVQPGLEHLMTPRPVYDDPERRGSGRLAGKAALVTGGDSGIGRAVSLAFAKEGADVAVVYLNEHRDAEETEAMVKAQGRRCLLLPGDVGGEAFCAQAAAGAVSAFGHLDILVNNAGVQFPQNSLLDIPAEQLEATFRVNVFGMFFLTRAALPYLPSGGSVINTASVTAYEGDEQLLDYSATKGAIVSFTRALARSLAKQGVRVNAVAPGPVWTPLQPSSWPEDHIPAFGADTPLGRPGQPAELAPAYVYLASEEASFVTGQVLHVDGGASMQS